jgi:RNA polymerase sigma-70 factor (ECF subfamily)
MSVADPDRDAGLAWNDLQRVSDTELVRQLVQGNHDALAVIVDRYQGLVLSVARRIVKDEGEAEEVAQIVFTEIFQHAKQFDPSRGTLKMWALQYAYSRGINRRRHLERQQFYFQGNLDVAEVQSCPIAQSGRFSSGETSRLVRQALRVLNPKQQLAIKLVYFEGLTLEEAAHSAGETSAAIRNHYYRGLMKLRQFIASERPRVEEPLGADAIRLEVGDADPRPI